MEREVSTAMTLGVSMCTLAIVLSIVFLTVSIGNEIKSNTYNKAVDMQVKTESGTLSNLRGKDTELSMAAVFGIIQNTEGYIGKIDISRIEPSYANKSVTECTRYIQSHLSGRVRLAVNFNTEYSYYELELHKVQCKDIYSSHDSCN